MGFEELLRYVALALARFTSFSAHALLFGAVPILLWVLRPVFSTLDRTYDEARARVAGRMEDLVQASLIASAVASLLALVLQAVLVSEIVGEDIGGESFSSVFDTTFGRWYLVRFPVMIGLWILLTGRVRVWSLRGAGDDRPPPNPVWWITWTALSLVLLSTSSFSGHAAVSTPRAGSLANDVVHLSAGGLWFAGIVVLASALPMSVRGLDPLGRLRLLAPTVLRFSTVALLTITVVAITGTVNSFLHVGAANDLIDSSYGRILGIKIMLFFVILAMGAINHFVLRRRLLGALSRGRATSAAQVFRRTIAIELTVAILIFGATGILTGAARTRQTPSPSLNTGSEP